MNNRSSSCSKAKAAKWDAEYENTDSEPKPLPAGKLLALRQSLRSGSVSLPSRNVRPGLSNRNPGHHDQPQPPQARSESEPGPGPGPEIPPSRVLCTVRVRSIGF